MSTLIANGANSTESVSPRPSLFLVKKHTFCMILTHHILWTAAFDAE
jgi:hypothetical protein